MTDEQEPNKLEEKQKMVERAEAAADRLEKANAELKENLLKQQTLEAEKKLAGTANAGADQPKEKTQEEKDIEGAKKLLAGTGYDKELFPDK